MKKTKCILIALFGAGLLLRLPAAWAADGPTTPPQAKKATRKALPPSKYVNDEGEVVRRVWTTTKLRRWMEKASKQYEALPKDVKPESHEGRMRKALGARIELFKELLATRESAGSVGNLQQELERERARIESELKKLQDAPSPQTPNSVDRKELEAQEAGLSDVRKRLAEVQQRSRERKEQLENLPRERQTASEREEKARQVLKELPQSRSAAADQKGRDYIDLLMKNARLEHRLAQEHLLWLERQQGLLEEGLDLDAEHILKLKLQVARLEQAVTLYRQRHGLKLEEERRELMEDVAQKQEDLEKAEAPSEKFLARWQARLAEEKAGFLKLEQIQNRWRDLAQKHARDLGAEKAELNDLQGISAQAKVGRAAGLRLKMSYARIEQRRAALASPLVPDLEARMDELQGQQLALQQEIRELDAGFQESMEKASASLPAAGRGAYQATALALREQVRKALLERSEQLDKVVALGERLEVQTVERRETLATTEALILSQVFWIRDARPLGAEELSLVGTEVEQQFAWLGRLADDLKAGRLTGDRSIPALLAWAFLLLLLLPALLMVLQLRLTRKMKALAAAPDDGASCRELRSQDRAWSLAFGLLSALPLPIYGLLLSWWLSSNELGAGLQTMLPSLLVSFSVLLLIWLTSRNLLGRHCLATQLLQMPEAATRSLYRFIRYLLLAYFFLMVPARVWQGAPFSFTALPRLAYTLFFLLALAGLVPLLRRRSSLVQALTGENDESLLRTAWPVFSSLTILLFITILIMDVLGYRFGAAHLARSAALSLVSVFVLTAIYRLALGTLNRHSQRRDTESTDAPGEEDAEEKRLAERRFRRFLRSAFVLIGVVLIALFWDIGAGALNEIVITSFTNAAGELEKVSVGDLLTGLAILLGTVWIVRNLRALLDVFIFSRTRMAQGSRYAILTISRWALFVIGALLTLSAVHLDLGRIGWLVAAMGVGIGFGLQEIIANMVSGVILLVERPIRVGDLLTVGEISGEVKRINIRATTILNFDRQEVIVPNKDFITKEVTNWTLADRIMRLKIPIGVAYGSDIAAVRDMLVDIARKQPEILRDPPPRAFFMSHGDSSLDFQLFAYLSNPDDRWRVTDRINSLINEGLKERGIEIPFPQQDLHLRSGELPVHLQGEKSNTPES